jgi:hypothetical protein
VARADNADSVGRRNFLSGEEGAQEASTASANTNDRGVSGPPSVLIDDHLRWLLFWGCFGPSAGCPDRIQSGMLEIET